MLSLNISQNDIGSSINTFHSVIALFKPSKARPNQAQCPLIEELILSSNSLTNKNIDDLTEVLNNCPKINLKRLDFSNNKFSSKGLVSLIQCLKNNPQIKISHLNFERANLDSGTLQESLVNYKLLIRLIFEFLRTNKNLMYLNLSHCFLSNDVMTQIGKALLTNDKLQTLLLRGNKIDLDGLKELFKSCQENKNIKLKQLDLSSNKLNDEAGPQIASAMKQVQTLEQLILKDNSLGSESSDAFLFLVKEKTNLWKLQLDLNMIKYMTLLEIEKTCKRNKIFVQKEKLPVIRKEISHFLNKRDPNIRLDSLDAQVKRQKKEIEKGFQFVLEEEEFVHDIINQGDEELKELEEIKNQLDEEANRLDTVIEGIDQRIYSKQRECERKVVDELILVEKCQSYNLRLTKRIEKQKQRNMERRTQLTKVGEEGKLLEDLQELQKEEKMLSLIIENYEKEIQKRENTEEKRCVSIEPNSNLLHSILSQEKDIYRMPTEEDTKPKRCISTGKDGIKKRPYKKSKGRSTKKAVQVHQGVEKHIKGLLQQVWHPQEPQQLDVKQK